jgi:DNA polymerase I-like protein with 3'-5' exonuclease and polymerase domains
MERVLTIFDPQENLNMLPAYKGLLAGKLGGRVTNAKYVSAYEAAIDAKNIGARKVVTNSPSLLKNLLGLMDVDNAPKISNYEGTIIEKAGVEFLIIPPLSQLFTMNTGKFIMSRYLSKFWDQANWMKLPQFKWELFDFSMRRIILDELDSASFVSMDIETKKEDLAITCLGITLLFFNENKTSVSHKTYVIPFNDMNNILFAREAAAHPVAKIFQNGKYDISYLLRYNIPVASYYYDTINLFHCMYSELPKDLGFLGAWALRNFQFWKNEKSSQDLMVYYGYNAKDAFSTAFIFLSLVREMPPYAISNYKQEFPTVIPCILAEATGIKWDIAAVKALGKTLEEENKEATKKLGIMVGNTNFNPGSSQQVVKLLNILGCPDIKSSQEKYLAKAATRHPLNGKIFNSIISLRKLRKMHDTYTQPEKALSGRILYALNPHGTDTGRLASKESHFWCGLQIQNVPRDTKKVSFKSTFISDPDFYLAEADGEQAEARTSAYISGDLELIKAVEGDWDYHGLNASKFFGVPYEEIIGPNGEQLNKELRDLSKRTNHGANYNMGPAVMLETMGIPNVVRAKKLLGLPTSWSLLKVCEYLLQRFTETYPTLRKDYYKKVIDDVENVGFLVGATGWTRRCFGHPKSNKLDLNSYVAHNPQSLNAMIMNKAWVNVFNEVYVPNPQNFKLLAQIHDSIFFQYRKGHEHLAYAVKKAMEIPVEVKDIFGISRTLVVPIALKGEGTRWNELQTMK